MSRFSPGDIPTAAPFEARFDSQARGRVVDTDMAIESTKLAQDMILSQAAQQAINMATQRQQTVLQLLKT